MDKTIDASVNNLKLFWNGFLTCEDDEIKAKWLELFSFEYKNILKIDGQFSLCNNVQFLSSVPSQLTAYLLQLVYGKICASLLSPNIPTLVDDSEDLCLDVDDNVFGVPTGYTFNNITDNDQLVNAIKPSDITTVIALREFLISGIGGKILELLLQIDTKNILCAQELMCLLFHLFPTGPWDIGNSENAPKENIEDYQSLSNAIECLGNLNDEQDDVVRKPPCTSTPTISPVIIKDLPSSIDINDKTSIEQYITDTFCIYSNQIFTCDYIGSIVINLISKLVAEEKHSNIDRNSITIQPLYFAVETYCELRHSNAFTLINREKLRRKLLTLMFMCLYNIFGKYNRNYGDLLEIATIFEQLLDALSIECNDIQNFQSNDGTLLTIKLEHISALIYSMFLMLHILFRKSTTNADDLSHTYHKLFDLIIERADCILKILKILIDYRCHSIIQSKLIQIICNTIYDVRRRNNIGLLQHQLFGNQMRINYRRTTTTTSTKRKRKSTNPSTGSTIIMCTHHHGNTHRFGCVLEKILLNIACDIDGDNLMIIYKFIYKNPICCCNNDLLIVRSMLINSTRNRMQKKCLNFIKKNFLKTLYSNIECNVCDSIKSQSITTDIGYGFLKFYIDWILSLTGHELIIFLKHIVKISKYIPFDVTVRILSDVVLPPFRREINRLNRMEMSGDDVVMCKKIIVCCLNVFLCYLRDIRLIKGFYNAENVQYMEKLIVVPEFASLICCLLKIGIDNASFLGENSGEQLQLSDRLRHLLIQSIENVSDVLFILFEDIGKIDGIQLKSAITTTEANEIRINSLLDLIKSKQLSIENILHLSVVYWNLILQLFRTNAQFKTIFQQIFLRHKINIIFHLVYNSLSCYLFTSTPNNVMGNNANIIVGSTSVQHEPALSTATSILLNDYCWIPTSSSSNCDSLSLIYPNSQVQQTNNNEEILKLLNNNSDRNCDDTVCLNVDNSLTSIDGVYKPNGIFSICHDIDFNEIISNNVQHSNNIISTNCNNSGSCSFASEYLTNNNINNKSVNQSRNYIFNLKNNKSETSLDLLSSSSIHSDTANRSTVDILSFGVQKLQNLISDSVYKIFYSNSTCDLNDDEDIKLSHDECDNKIHAVSKNCEYFDSDNIIDNESKLFGKENLLIFNESVEQKKIFLQLFEITCGVMMSDQNRETRDHKMSNSLKELKSILLQHSLNACDSSENGKSIINALQSLLKVAEMRYNSCFIEKCNHSSYARRSRYALNTFTDSNFQCCDHKNQKNGNLNNDEFSSELEQSEEESTSEENYLTADEGYDGDAEHANIFDTTDIDETNLIQTIQVPPASRYRNHVVHNGLCRIVIDILIDLSKRCIVNPYFWPNYLMQIASRFATIRESLGGSLHLIKGFATVLECNDVRLKDFQKSILELITDINTPETFCAYLSLMFKDDSPVDLLLPRLVYLGGYSFRLQPSFSIDFPTENDESIKATCDPLLLKYIKEIHDYHENHNLKTPFTQSSFVIPLNYINFNPWHQLGFTVTTWINFKPQQNVHQMRSSVDLSTNDDDDNISRRKCDEHYLNNMTHLLSIGSNKLLLSIYINSQDSNTLYFQLSKPCDKIVEQQQQKATIQQSRSNVEVFGSQTTIKRIKSPCCCTTIRPKRRQSTTIVPYDKETSIATGLKKTNTNLNNGGIANGGSSTKNTIKSTRLAIKNSFSQFSFFSSIISDPDGELNSFRYPLEVKGLKMPKNKWTHLSFSVMPSSNKELAIRITIDGLDQHDIHLPYPSQIAAKDKFQILCVGHKLSMNDNKAQNSSDDSGDCQWIEQPLPYSIANVCVFHKCLYNSAILANLVALGPDCTNFTLCQIGNTIPNVGFLQQNNYIIDMDISPTYALNILQKNVAAIFSAHDPSILLGYRKYDNQDKGDSLGLVTFGSGTKTKYISSLQTAVMLSGGLSTLLYLFARVVEISRSDFIQSVALSFLLRTAHSNAQLYTEFIKRDFISLIGPIIRSSKCIKSVHLLNSILDTVCDIPVLSTRANQFYVNRSTNACIVQPNLLISIINRYSDWHNGNKPTQPDIIEILFAAIQALVREKHPRQSLNIMRLTTAGIIPALLNFCKVYLIGIPQAIYLSNKAAESLVSLISTFAGAPPSPSLLDDITKVLLLLHRPSDSFITHDRSKFYFLLSSAVMIKPKRLSLQLPNRNLNLSIKRDRKNSAAVIRSADDTISESNRMQRSISLDNSSTSNEDSCSPNYKQRSIDECIRELSDSDDNNKENNVPVSTNVFHIDKDKRYTTLESIANCSRINGHSIMNRLNGGTTKLDKALMNMQIKRQILGKKRIHKRIRQKTKLRSSRTGDLDSETDRETQRMSSVSESGIEEDMVQEYVIIASDDIKKIDESFRFQQSNIFDNDSNDINKITTSDGIIHIQIGFFNLLKDFILILPDNSIQEVLTHFVTFDIILILANHYDTRVRSAIIRLLAVMCERLGTAAITQCTKSFYWHHLANQITLHMADMCLVQTCAQWITGSYLTLEQIAYADDIKMIEKHGLNSLIALLPQTVHDLNVSKLTIRLMEKLYKLSMETRQYFIENGLLPSLIKYLTKYYDRWGTSGNENGLMYIHGFLGTIAQMALLSSGTINILWDLLNGCSFMEEKKNSTIFRGLRITQAVVMTELFEQFFPQSKEPMADNFKFNSSLLNPIDCTLSSNEKKTRFDLLIDRIVQFITNVDPSHIQTDEEIKLIEYIVMLSVTGYQRGSNVIPWALCPSRPISLKLYICTMLWKYIRKGNLSTLGCDGKIVKTLIQSFFETDCNIITLSDLDVLTKVCNSLGIVQAINNNNLSQTLEKLDSMRETSVRDHKPAIDRTVFKFEPIVQTCIDSAMKITRDVVELQNVERRILMNEMRGYDENKLCIEWKLIISRMTHEGAPWHCSSNYPSSWELDQTEGPARVRVRFKRCQLNIDKKFFVPEIEQIMEETQYKPPLSYLNDALVKRPNFALSDQVLFAFTCKHLPIDTEIDGEMIITESHLIFLANNIEHDPINIDIVSITEIWLKRYQHQENGLEFFLESNCSLFFILQSNADRSVLIQYFADKVVQCPDVNKLSVLMQQWKEGQLTNWEYLMALNQISGRTYQDLMQYPVFPWILANYDGATLNLNDLSSFRILEKPIAVQSKESEMHFINNYEYLKQALCGTGTYQMAPYHYGSHYSNSGTVLHFLVRIPPFTKFFLHYQDNNFDLPDRTFHSMTTTWRLASKDSTTDVKELIPEFYCLPEIFENSEGFNFGQRQSGESVNSVTLPKWANESSRLFVFIHRQALESNAVRSNLHKWIDLIFGYKQTGHEAIYAINVFHPATYIGFSSNVIIDPVEKKAFETMVRTYGQMPRQLIKSPHPMITLTKEFFIENKEQIIPNVQGLKWGIYTGSPQMAEPRICNFYQQFDVIFHSLIAHCNTNVMYGIPKRCNIMQGSEPDTMNLIMWNESDGIVRIKSFCDQSAKSQALLQNQHIDDISACGTDPQSSQLWFGHKSGRITVYESVRQLSSKFNKNRFYQHSTTFSKMSYNSAFRSSSSKDVDKSAESIGTNNLIWKNPVVLIRHTNEVTNIQLSNEFKIVVSVGKDGLAIIWDLNKLQFIRSIQDISKIPISLTIISPTLGDIITIHSPIDDDNDSKNNDENDSDNDESASDCLEATENIDDFVNVPHNLNGKKTLMRLHTINCKYVNHVTMIEKVRAACYSYIKEGTGINVIATGLDGGVIRLWSSWDLTLIKELNVGKINVISLMYSTYQHLVVLTSDNVIQVWESPELLGSAPKFPQILSKRGSI